MGKDRFYLYERILTRNGMASWSFGCDSFDDVQKKTALEEFSEGIQTETKTKGFCTEFKMN